MIPNALSNTGPYAGLWSHLKSIDYALQRALSVPSTTALTALDQERLMSLSELLQYAQVTGTLHASDPAQPLSIAETDEPAYAEAIDLRSRLESLEAVKNWKSTSRMGFDAKLKRLNEAVNGFVRQTTGDLFARDVPRDEFSLLRTVLQHLLSEAEAALQH